MNTKHLLFTAHTLLLFFVTAMQATVMANEFNIQSSRNLQICERSDDLENALTTAKSTIKEANLLLNCADAIANRSPSRYCIVSDHNSELEYMTETLDEVSKLLLPAVIAARPAPRNDPYPRYILQTVNSTVVKLDDFTTLPGDELESIERCSGGRLSYDCLTLVHACAGDFECYGDETCACYTCNGGSCGIN